MVGQLRDHVFVKYKTNIWQSSNNCDM